MNNVLETTMGWGLIFASLLLTSCDDNNNRTTTTRSEWHAGPIIGERNYSINSIAVPEAGAVISLPIGPTSEPHYVTKSTGSLAGKTTITARFKIEGDDAAIIYGKGCPITKPSVVSLYFETDDVDWTKDGDRWWAKHARSAPLKVNTEFTVTAMFDDEWGSVLQMNSTNNRDWFLKDRQNAGRVGFTFSNCEGSGHGARATSPVKFTVLEYTIR